MRRIIVVGAPGAGKTTFASALSQKLQIPHTEIDSLWWGPDWTPVGNDALKARLAEVVGREAWVVDGNYFTVATGDVVWPRADTVVWLDLPRRVSFRRLLGRTMGRMLARKELWSGNRETFRNVFFDKESVLYFAWREHAKYGRYHTIATQPEFQHIELIRLRSPRDVRRWLAEIGG